MMLWPMPSSKERRQKEKWGLRPALLQDLGRSQMSLLSSFNAIASLELVHVIPG